ncbi:MULTISPECIES: DUF3833 domain-containing protein [Diaphorobacter]|uniref:DUF3833 domain-containing protein n=1 Tax=Diaphorobacter TaxID=238749 RepID=UPI000643B76A|nr:MULTISPECIES: DUF3833 domain-containing protein [Diaphorobacter]KLR57563.1 lipoprotein [Diaphorobacter sp. J5-51]PZU37839.1 MAG: DUF3833 domain-containing protein [Acidovorax sp.]
MNTRRHALLALLAGTAVLTGCASPQVTDYAQERPQLELDRYFNGRILAHGIFQQRGGEVVRRFTVVMDCHWEGHQGVLDEAFTYSEGSTQRRIWRLTKHADGRYTGTADDVVGEAQGQTAGNAFRWNYTLRLPVDGKEYEVQFDDWMFLVDDRVMLNRATMRKFGLTLGEVLLSFTKT